MILTWNGPRAAFASVNARACTSLEVLAPLLSVCTPPVVLQLYSSEPWSSAGTRGTRLVGDKIQAVGRWRLTPTNRNFMSAAGGGEEEEEASSDAAGETAASDGGDDPDGDEEEEGSARPEEDEEDGSDDDDESALRRAEFTILALAA